MRKVIGITMLLSVLFMLPGCFLAEYSDLEDKIEELEEKVA